MPKPLGLVGCTDLAALKAGISRDVTDTASTNLEDGLRTGGNAGQGRRAANQRFKHQRQLQQQQRN